ncbi:hypothetical protein SKAU_G00399050 [Synaphobranchus kaupii]|uniref:Uncharacterized protein n=1 Tax=Synaphobranchus kaupii TaxID=118154 RepID=A0A9Q1E8M7_SYNKA|nr:hypothetical protein SKAU_G00399050 [Synaphobranchus kaupii]
MCRRAKTSPVLPRIATLYPRASSTGSWEGSGGVRRLVTGDRDYRGDPVPRTGGPPSTAASVLGKVKGSLKAWFILATFNIWESLAWIRTKPVACSEPGGVFLSARTNGGPLRWLRSGGLRLSHGVRRCPSESWRTA